MQPRLPAQPRSSSRKTTTPRPGVPSRSTASIPATTPSVPSNRPAPGTEHYFNADSADYLHVVTVGEQKLIGRYVKDGFPASDMDNVSRNVCSIVKLITRGHRIEEGYVHIYAA